MSHILKHSINQCHYHSKMQVHMQSQVKTSPSHKANSETFWIKTLVLQIKSLTLKYILTQDKKFLPHLARDILVRKSNYKPILRCVILVLVLNGKAKTSIVVSLALTTPFELNLKALEILLILHDFYEALQRYSHLNIRKRPVTSTRNMPRTMWYSKWSGTLNMAQNPPFFIFVVWN